MNPPIHILFGPTASGKSALALSIAKAEGAVIINCDSKQLYREIPIITAQPSTADFAEVPHELYGVISAAEHCSVGRWIELVKPVIERVWAAEKLPLLVGGTGMYIKYLTEGIPAMPEVSDEVRFRVREQIAAEGSAAVHRLLDSHMQQKLQPGDSQRVARAYEIWLETGRSLFEWQREPAMKVFPEAQFRTMFLSPPRQQVYDNCDRRFKAMMEAGGLEEVRALDAMGVPEDLPAMKAHGVPELRAYMHGTMTLEDAIAQAQKNTRHYIKRQFTWFRGQMPGAEVLRASRG